MVGRAPGTTSPRSAATAVALLLAILALLAVPPAADAGPQPLEFRNATPEAGSTVPAGQVTIGVEVIGLEVGRVAMLLNTELIPLAREGAGKSVRVSATRVLAPGDYTVFVTAEDPFLGRWGHTWRFTVRHADPVPVGFSQVDARIQIVYPHGGAPVSEATRANVGVLLFTPGTRIPVPLDFDRPVRLWRAVNSDPAHPITAGTTRDLHAGTKVLREVDGMVFPAWEFNDVDVGPARLPGGKIAFFVSVDGLGTNSNVWVHGADPRTVFPEQDVPTAVWPWPGEGQNPALDSRIEIVYPHEGAPVGLAKFANIGADLFRSGTLDSVDPSRDPLVFLIRSLNAEVATPATVEPGWAAVGTRTMASTGGVVHPRWVFNSIDVSAANTSPNLIQFRAVVADPAIVTHPNVWAHGADARTFFPVQDVPSRSAEGSLPR